MSALRDHLGNRVRSLREEKGMDQEALGAESGMSASYISKLERGAIPNPKVFDLHQIARALDTTAPELMRQPPGTRTERYSMVCNELVQQLENEPPELADAVLRAWQVTADIARTRHEAQNN